MKDDIKELMRLRDGFERELWFSEHDEKYGGYMVGSKDNGVGYRVADDMARPQAEYISQMHNLLPNLISHIESLEEALEFYANEGNNEFGDNDIASTPVEDDCGKIAKQALDRSKK